MLIAVGCLAMALGLYELKSECDCAALPPPVLLEPVELLQPWPRSVEGKRRLCIRVTPIWVRRGDDVRIGYGP